MSKGFFCLGGEWVNLDHVVKFYTQKEIFSDGDGYWLIAVLHEQTTPACQVFRTEEDAEARLTEIIGKAL